MLTTNRRFRRSALWSSALTIVLAGFCAACSGGAGGGSTLPSAGDLSSPLGTVSRTDPSSSESIAASSSTFNTWPTYGYNNAHNGFNPNTKLFTTASVAQLHLGWQRKLAESGTQTQPILAANVGTHKGLLFVGGRLGIEYAFDALSGAQVWSRSFGSEQMQCVNKGPLLTLGSQATAVYDPVAKVVYMVDGTNSAPNASQTITVYKLDPATGSTLGSVNITPTNLPGEIDFAHTGLTLAGGTLYVGTGSTCDLSSWRGRLAAVNVNSMTLGNTFFPVYNQGGAYSGGGVWGWGGAAVDVNGNVYIGAGNADINAGAIAPKAPFITTVNEQAGYGEHVVKLTSDLSTVVDSHAIPYSFNKTARNLDLSGTPVLFAPVGCPSILAIQGKSGLLNFYSAANIGAGPLASFTFSEAVDEVSYIGNGTYSPLTGFYYANVPTMQGGSIEPPGMVAIGVTNCNKLAIAWHSQFGADSYNIGSHNGQPRSAPTVTAGNLVFVASPTAAGTSQLWVLDATTGAILNNAAPVLTTANLMRMPPVVDGKWIYVLDQGGNFYGLTIDPNVPRVKAQFTQSFEPTSSW